MKVQIRNKNKKRIKFADFELTKTFNNLEKLKIEIAY